MEMKLIFLQATKAYLKRPDSFSRRHPILSSLMAGAKFAAIPLIVGAAVLVFAPKDAKAGRLLAPALNWASAVRASPLAFAGPSQFVAFGKTARDGTFTNTDMVWVSPVSGMQAGVRYTHVQKDDKVTKTRGGAIKLTAAGLGGKTTAGAAIASTTKPNGSVSQTVDVAASVEQPAGLPIRVTGISGQGWNGASIDAEGKSWSGTVTFRDPESGEVFAFGLDKQAKYSEKVGQRFYASIEMPQGAKSVATVGTRLIAGKAGVEANMEVSPTNVESVSLRLNLAL